MGWSWFEKQNTEIKTCALDFYNWTKKVQKFWNKITKTHCLIKSNPLWLPQDLLNWTIEMMVSAISSHFNFMASHKLTIFITMQMPWKDLNAPFMIYYLDCHGNYIQMDFLMKCPKIIFPNWDTFYTLATLEVHNS
jgi:hypothetical protein